MSYYVNCDSLNGPNYMITHAANLENTCSRIDNFTLNEFKSIWGTATSRFTVLKYLGCPANRFDQHIYFINKLLF